MKAILINPFEQTVTEVDYDGDYRQIYRFIDADAFDCATISNGDGIFVDDCGMMNGPTHFFSHDDYPQPLAGKGLLVGCNEWGESVDCVATLEETRAKVKFTNILELRRRYAA